MRAHVLLLLFLCSSSNAQQTYYNSRRTTLSRILAGCIVAVVIISALLWYSQRQRRMRRNRPLIAVTTVPQNQYWAGGGPAPYQGFQSPGPSYNPPVGGYNEFPSYPPNYALPAYGKDAPGGFQQYPPPTGSAPSNQIPYSSVKHPVPAHVTGQDGAGSPWS